MGSFTTRLARWWVYFSRGHSTYFVFFLSFANFVVIQYRLLLDYVPPLQALFSSLTAFAVTFFLVYVPTAVVIGWLDYKKFAVPVTAALGALVSPYTRDVTKALVLMCEGRNEEAKELLRKWSGEAREE